MASLAFPDVETSIAADDVAIEDPAADVFASAGATDDDGEKCRSVWAVRRAGPAEMRVSTHRIKNERAIQVSDDVRWTVDDATTPREFAERFTDEPLSFKVNAARDAHDAFERGALVDIADSRPSLPERIRTAAKNCFLRASLAVLDRLDRS